MSICEPSKAISSPAATAAVDKGSSLSLASSLSIVTEAEAEAKAEAEAEAIPRVV